MEDIGSKKRHTQSYQLMIITIYRLFAEKTGAVRALHHLLYLLTSTWQAKLFTAQDSEADCGFENTIRWGTAKMIIF